MTLTMEKLMQMGEDAKVQIACGAAYRQDGSVLPPHLWEPLRQEMQKRLRRATGEPHAIVTFEFGTEVRT